jgi:sec-independent protein translocase protein TatA
MGISVGHILLVLLIILILFGAGKLPQVMAEMSKGLKAFREGMKEEESKPSVDAYSSPLPPLSLSEPGVEPDGRRSGRVSVGEKKKVVPLKKPASTAKKEEKKEKTSSKAPAPKTKSSSSPSKKKSTSKKKSSSLA